jgi:hypothetical protein
MLSEHIKTKTFSADGIKCTVTRDYVSAKQSVFLYLGDSKGQSLKSIQHINELIELLKEVRHDIEDDVARDDQPA